MAKRGRGKRTLASASITALERALGRRKRDVARLEKKRDTLRARLAKVDADLAKLQGAAVAAPAGVERPERRGRRRRRTMSLAVAIAQALKDAKKPMRAAEVTEAVLAAGYKTRAKNFKQIVHSTLTRHPEAARAGKGLYVLKGGPAAAKPKATASKKRVKRARRKRKKAAAT